ncbi:MAG TPA: T9SS type A sorting domain-containing protein [Edaphocola sp.]|nr:T9SS type A sorting domain-containing protein [Edaphocola sp.]
MKKLLCFVLATLFGSSAAFATYDTLSISSGYNADVIANGVGSASTTTSNDVDGANYAYVSNGWQSSSSATGITTGLPADGIVNSALTTGLQFQLADYSSNNSLRLTGSNNGTLDLQTPVAAQTLYILAVTGSGSSTMTVTINFSDGTTQSQSSMTVSDWYGGTNVALTGFQRVNRLNNLLDNAFNGPNLYQYSIAITTANQAKTISSVEFERTGGSSTGSVLNIFALSIEESAITCPQPTALTTANITTTSADLGWTEAGSATQWEISYGPAGTSAAGGTHVFTTTNPKTITGLTAATGYEFHVRAICGPGDTSLWSGPKTFSSDCGTAPTITSTTDGERCGKGVITLHAQPSSGIVRWYAAATGGSPLDTGNSFTTAALTASQNYYVAAAAHYQATCETGTRQLVAATVHQLPTVDLGNDTVICQGTSITLDAENPGDTYLWSSGATTQTIHATSSGVYYVKVTDGNNCSNADTVVLNSGIQPEDSLPVISNLCVGDSIILDAANIGSSYSWNTGDNTQTIKVGAGGNYSVAVTSTDGCVGNFQTNVVSRPLPVVDLGGDTAICGNNAITLDAHNPGSSYVWNTGDTTRMIGTTDSGRYSVVVTDKYGCVSGDTMHLAFIGQPYVNGFNFIPQFYERLGQVVFHLNHPIDVQSCLWNFGDGSPESTDFNPTHTYDINGGVYIVTLTVYNTCGSYTVTLPIEIDTKTGVVTVADAASVLTVYPNPAKDYLMLQVADQNTIEQAALYDISGREVEKAGYGPSGQNKVKVRTGNLPSGIYLLRVKTKAGWQSRKVELVR